TQRAAKIERPAHFDCRRHARPHVDTPERIAPRLRIGGKSNGRGFGTRMRPESYLTPGGISVARTISKVSYARGLAGLLRKLDTQRGIYLSSGYEYPERYS